MKWKCLDIVQKLIKHLSTKRFSVNSPELDFAHHILKHQYKKKKKKERAVT